MRILFIGSVQFSLEMLEHLIERKADVIGVCTKKSSSFNSDHVDLSLYSELNSIPWKLCDDINSPETTSWIRELHPDVIFCFGWSQLIKEEILKIAPSGVFGFHPSALPINRGRHPIIWALVLGLKETASTFFRIDLGADSGDIISQERVDINSEDDASSLYRKIVDIAKLQLNAILPKLESGTIEFHKQSSVSVNYWRKRSWVDGEIDWRMSAEAIHNLVRGLSAPYPGAHFLYKGIAVKVWKTTVCSAPSSNIEPGKVFSVMETGPIVKCGLDAIRLIETEPHFEPAEGEYL